MLSYIERFLNDDSNIDKNDLDNISPLSKMDALLFGDSFFPEIARYALLVGRSYGEPKMSLVFDESNINNINLTKKLKSMHTDNTVIYFFWDIYSAVKTTWGLLIKYWDNFCCSGDESIIYVNPNEIYLYSDMLLKKINQSEPNQNVLSNKGLYMLRDDMKRRELALTNLLEGLPRDIQDDLYLLFHSICEGVKTIKDNELSKGYIDYYKYASYSLMITIIVTCKPYIANDNSFDDYINYNNESNKLHLDNFYDLLRKQIKQG